MIEVGNTVFFARAIPSVDIYETLELTIRSSGDNWVVGVDSSTRQAFPFSKSEVGTLIFSTRSEAEEIVKAAKKKYGVRKLTKVRDEEDE